MQKFLFFAYLSISFLFTQAQTPTQNIKGKVFDMDSKQPLVGATVQIADSLLGIGAMTDDNGEFRLENVPVGRQTVLAEYLNYKNYSSGEILLTSGKELELNIAMTEAIASTNAVVITANGDKVSEKVKPNNEFQTVSTRQVSMEQVMRQPTTFADPSRAMMATPGVQQSRDYQNDIVIRGNASSGLVWRLEGIDIANPNHFGRVGGSGGSISIFSLSLMGQSDFSTGAFAPEYGNATSGVFDMHFRNGNSEKREYTFRAGFIGLDFATEGPIQKGKSSYLVNYRYSTLGLLGKLGFRLAYDNSSSTFQDLSFNLHFKQGNKGSLNVFGVGGISQIWLTPSSDTTEWDKPIPKFSDYYMSDYKTRTGSVGFNYTYLLDEKSYLRVVGVATANRITGGEDTISRLIVPYPLSRDDHTNGRYATTVSYNRKFSARTALRAGVFVNRLFFSSFASVYNRVGKSTDTLQNAAGNAWLIQPYAQIRYRITEKMTFTGGFHSLYFFLNNTYSFEPRAALAYTHNDKHSFTFAYGLHGQTLPIGTYFATVKGQTGYPNLSLKMQKAHHLVAGYNLNLGLATHIKTEAYYQYLFNLPVSTNIDSTYAAINDRYGYGRGHLTSKGTGQNYGVDITLEQFLSKHAFFLISTSLYKSQYQPLNGITYSTRYDSRFSTSSTLGKEFVFKNGGAIETGVRIIYTGGLRYSPVDSVLSFQTLSYVSDATRPYTMQYPNYFRTDARVAYRWSRPKYSASVSLDIQNLTDKTNPMEQYWNPQTQSLAVRNGNGIIAIVTGMIDF